MNMNVALGNEYCSPYFIHITNFVCFHPIHISEEQIEVPEVLLHVPLSKMDAFICIILSATEGKSLVIP